MLSKNALRLHLRAFAVAMLGLLAAPRAPAQEDTSPAQDVVSIQDREGYVAAVQAIAAGKERDGLAVLAELAVRFADDPDLYLLHYNAACGHARVGELDAGFAALDQAVTCGYTVHPQRLQNLLSDPDLDRLRADPRFVPLRDRAITLHEALRDSYPELIAPYEFIPPPPADPAAAATSRPLLIVLHPYGAERADYARRYFEPFCAAHGFALFAPGGPQMIAPERFAFFGSPADFVDGFRMAQRKIVLPLDDFRRRANVDPQRIYVTGSGQGAGLGFAIAMRNPQWVRGAVLFEGGYAPATLKDWTANAVKFGRRVALVHGDGDPRYPLAPLESFVEQLESQGIAVRLFAEAGPGTLTPESVTAALARHLAWVDEAPFERPAAPGR